MTNPPPPPDIAKQSLRRRFGLGATFGFGFVAGVGTSISILVVGVIVALVRWAFIYDLTWKMWRFIKMLVRSNF